MYVYFFQIADKHGLIKIGRSRDPDLRIKKLQTSSPYKLKKLAVVQCKSHSHSVALERQLHEIFKFCRVDGEWFTQNQHLREAAAALSLGGDFEYVIQSAKKATQSKHRKWSIHQKAVEKKKSNCGG